MAVCPQPTGQGETRSALLTLKRLENEAIDAEMNPDLVSLFAVWGAVVSTAALIWNIWRWTRERPIINAVVKTYEALDEGIEFTIRNRGGAPTTIEEITLLTYESGVAGLLRMKATKQYLSAAYRKTAKLPAILAPGGVWRGTAPFLEHAGPQGPDNREHVEAGRLFYKIQCSHRRDPYFGRVRIDWVSWLPW